MLINAWKSGCRFDGWTDFFDYDRWVSVFKKSAINPNYYTDGCADVEQPLPWDHIDIGVERSFLIKEMARAAGGKITADCRTGTCSGCGVCDFETLKPISYHDQKRISSGEELACEPQPSDPSMHYVVNFKKMNTVRFLGHLEMVKIFIRSLRRANIPLKYSHGLSSHAQNIFRGYPAHGDAK